MLVSPLQPAARAAATVLPYVPVAAAYSALRMLAMRGFAQPVTYASARTAALTVPSALLFYCRQWLLPLRTSEFYDLALQQQFDAKNVCFQRSRWFFSAD